MDIRCVTVTNKSYQREHLCETPVLDGNIAHQGVLCVFPYANQLFFVETKRAEKWKKRESHATRNVDKD